MAKKQKVGIGSRIAPIIIGAILVIGSMIPVSASLFGQTGYITEITSSKRSGGALRDGSMPNTYEWHVGYKFKTKNGEYETGSVTVKGDAISSKSRLRAGSPVRYLAFAPGFNVPGEGGFDVSTIMYVFCIAFGVFMIALGARKSKPPKTPSQRSREYRSAKAAKEIKSTHVKTKASGRASKTAPVHRGGEKMFCENCGAELSSGAKFCSGCGESQQASQQVRQPTPDWDSFEYDDKTPITEAEAEELYRLATEEEIEDEFDLINSGDEGPAYYRKVLAIVRWRRDN
ncbi:MAG: zinc ribbon domain-containing protein [Synergistaceae bacterium]|nr:zinc ribbon domain-containing protein [Synergistaceae bacterium]